MSFRRVLCAVFLCATLFAAAATAGTLASVTFNFESPSFTAGNNINGQNGWSNTGGYDAVVSNGAGLGGSQSLRISNGVGSGSFGDQTFTPHLGVMGGETAADNFQASWAFRSVTDSLQEGLFISVSADNGQGRRMTWIGMGDASDGLYVQFVDWDMSLSDPWHYTTLASGLDRNTWHSIAMNIDFLKGPGNDKVTVQVDNLTPFSGTTWEDFYRYGPVSDGGGPPLGRVDSLLFRARDQVTGLNGSGFYVDDVAMSAQAPEPGTVGLLLAGIGGMIALARRRRSAR